MEIWQTRASSSLFAIGLVLVSVIMEAQSDMFVLGGG